MSEVPIEGRLIEPNIDKGSYWDTPYRPVANFEAQLSFTREASGSWEEWINSALGMNLAPWQSRVLGQMEYTPREELRDRLNSWLRGDYPGEPINWKGLK